MTNLFKLKLYILSFSYKVNIKKDDIIFKKNRMILLVI